MATNIVDEDMFVWDFMQAMGKELEAEAEAEDDERRWLQEAQQMQPISRSRRYIDREREDGARRLHKYYFDAQPIYHEDIFRLRYRMSLSLFHRVLGALQTHDEYFTQCRNAAGRLGLNGHQKMTAALRMLAHGTSADAVDEYVRIGETTTLAVLARFCQGVYQIFCPTYLREPTSKDIARLSQEYGAKGFAGCLGCVDCMHWEWKNCPRVWAGQFKGHVSKPTIILEAVASYDTWIWHAFFGMPGSCNDLNVLQQSHLFDNLLNGHAPPTDFTVNGSEYHMGYYLGDGIYPSLATIVKAFRQPILESRVKFNEQQMGCRKDVERAFGILQARWRIVAGPTRFMKPGMLHLVMMTCVILHNMIVEDELRHPEWTAEYEQRNSIAEVVPEHPRANQTYSQMQRALNDKTVHFQLRNDLVEHQWGMRGQGTLG